MGAVAVHDYLMHQHHVLSHRSLPFLTPSPSNNPHKNARSLNRPKPAHLARRKRTPCPAVPPTKTTSSPPPDFSKNLLMGQVKILRRGEELPGSTEEASKGLLPLHIPPEEFVPARLVNGFYAGSAAFAASPPPSSVPLPGFLQRGTLVAFRPVTAQQTT